MYTWFAISFLILNQGFLKNIHSLLSILTIWSDRLSIRGRYQFFKHFYLEIEDLKEDGEEFECAKLIDSHPKIEFWVSNLVNRDGAAFRLPLAKNWFYPDFVAELVNGRLLVVEYKGKEYARMMIPGKNAPMVSCGQGKAETNVCFNGGKERCLWERCSSAD